MAQEDFIVAVYQARDISRNYQIGGGRGLLAALDKVSMTIDGARITAIVGPSGCGKTTFLNIFAGLDSSYRGQVLADGKPIEYDKVRFGCVFQVPSLIPWRRVMENAVLGIEIEGESKRARETKAAYWLTKYGLGDFVNYYPSSLSIGMQQRVSIIRAVVFGADILLLDEPFRGLDDRIRKQIELDLSSLVDQEGLTGVLVTHDIGQAALLADRVYVLSERPGRVVGSYDIALPRHSRFGADGQSMSDDVRGVVEKIWHDLQVGRRAAAVEGK